MLNYRQLNIERLLLSTGLFLLNILFFSLVLSTLLFMAGISVSMFHLPLAVLAAAAVSLLFEKRGSAATLLIGLAVLCGCMLLSGYVDDWSWDGNCYHKGIAGALCYGWNPLRESFYQFAGSYDFLSHCTHTWYDAYPKASELFSACAHILTGNIETGKAFNLLSIASLFFLGWGMLVHTGLFRHWQAAVCAGLAVLTPVNISQMFTFYNDGFLANMLLLCLIGLLYFTFYPQGELKRLAGYLIFAAINIGFNIKFSAILFFAILCLTFFGGWLVKGFRAVRNRFFLLTASVLSGVLFLGSTSYVTNTIRYHNPLYTMIGPGSFELITTQIPTVYRSMSNLERFIASLFSYTDTSLEMDALYWKIPFTFSIGELEPAHSCDVRVAGWGIFFSGIFLVSVAVIVLALIKCRRRHPEVAQITLVLSIMLAVAVPVIPGLCWARYFTSLFLVPVAALLFLFAWWNSTRGKGPLFCALALVMLLCANMAPNAVWSCSLLKDAHRTWEQLEEMKELTETHEVLLGYSGYDFFEGRMFNIYDAGITRFTFGLIAPEDITGTVFDGYPLYYKVTGMRRDD